MNEHVSLAGQFLLAMPGIGDPRFERAVIAMCVHDARGALGVGVGQTVSGAGLHGLLDQLDIPVGQAPDVPIHRGGPVDLQRGFVLHSLDWQGDDSLVVGDVWALTSTLDILRDIAAGQGPAHFLVAMGYAGWSEGQLDGEMTRHGWFATPGNGALLFDTGAGERWAAGFAQAGVDVRLLAGTTGHA